MKGTKQRLLEAALTLFSEKGYEAVGIESLAAAVGIKGPSIYKHFRSKQDLFDTLLEEMSRRYEEHSLFSRKTYPLPDPDTFSPEAAADAVLEHIHYSTHDPYIQKTRKLLTIEQFRTEQVRRIQQQRAYTDIVSYYTKVMQHLIDAGILRNEDPEMMAIEYISPISLQLYRIDRDITVEEEAKAFIRRHILAFYRLYQKQ